MGKDFSEIRRASDSTFYAPLKWTEARMIFTCSISDFFIKEADDYRDEIWEVIRKTPQHTYQILTKRPERIQDCLPEDWGAHGWPNVWLGVSVETQAYDFRIAQLIDIPAQIHFLSCEPLLGPLTLDFDPSYYWFGGIDWVIVGGESGPKARPMKEDWALDILDQCRRTNTPFFFKQAGGKTKCKCHGAWGCRLLDGRTYDEMPQILLEAR